MTKKEILPDILERLLAAATYPIIYKNAVDNADGTFTLSGICDIHHIQPGFTVTIDGVDFVVEDYIKLANGDWNIILKAGTASLPIFPRFFYLYKPFFFHGTPLLTETELKKRPVLSDKTPMVYLMEPFITKHDYSDFTSIDRRCKFTLCFLTQADIPDWLTDDFYHNSIHPMYKLAQDFWEIIRNSNLFYNAKQLDDTIFHTKFGINIRELGTKKLYFSENLSGVSMDIYLEIYAVDNCCDDGGTDALDTDYELREDDSLEMRETPGIEIRN